jgi:hypothetical protein
MRAGLDTGYRTNLMGARKQKRRPVKERRFSADANWRMDEKGEPRCQRRDRPHDL